MDSRIVTWRAARIFRVVVVTVGLVAWFDSGAIWSDTSAEEDQGVSRPSSTQNFQAFRNLYARFEESGDGYRYKPLRVNTRGMPLDHIKRPSPSMDGNKDAFEVGELRAKKYYAGVDKELGFGISSREKTLNSLLEYCGYSGLSSNDLENLDSDVLMDPQRIAAECSDPERFAEHLQDQPLVLSDIISIRFFSPKTTDVSGNSHPLKYSWRKLVRMRTRDHSFAKRIGVKNVYLLFNIYEPSLTDSPFNTAADNVQVILTSGAKAKLTQTAYFMLFDPPGMGGDRISYAVTSWDANNDPTEGKVDSRYYVPGACAHCHGGLSRVRYRVNFLDTDHWLDRVQRGNDFEAVGNSPWPALFDAGRDSRSQQFGRAFQAVRQANQEILEHNQEVDLAEELDEPSFQTRAAALWHSLHAESDAHFPPEQRGIPSYDGKIRWDPTNSVESELVNLLNRYCYRCHSSLMYNVFDKEAVLMSSDVIEYFVEEKYMPQDRALSEAQRKRLLFLLDALE